MSKSKSHSHKAELVDHYSKIHVKRRPNFEQACSFRTKRTHITKAEVGHFPICARTLYNKTSMFYGVTKSGKTIAMTHAAYALSNFIGQVYVVSPSEPSNMNFDRIVPPQAIIVDISKKNIETFFISLWNMQERNTKILKRAQREHILDSLYVLVRTSKSDELLSKYRHKLRKLEDIAEKLSSKPQSSYKVELYNSIVLWHIDRVTDAIISVKRNAINNGGAILANKRLTEDQQFTINHININPNTLLIMDDSLAELKFACKAEWFIRMFTRNRHCNLTVFIGAHADTNLSPDLRIGTTNSFYCGLQILRVNVTRGGMWSKKDIAKVNELIDYVEKYMPKHTKIVYVQGSSNPLQFYRAQSYGKTRFDIGARAFWNILYNTYGDGNSCEIGDDDVANPKKYQKRIKKSKSAPSGGRTSSYD
jgi:hypothetical protein